MTSRGGSHKNETGKIGKWKIVSREEEKRKLDKEIENLKQLSHHYNVDGTFSVKLCIFHKVELCRHFFHGFSRCSPLRHATACIIHRLEHSHLAHTTTCSTTHTSQPSATSTYSIVWWWFRHHRVAVRIFAARHIAILDDERWQQGISVVSLFFLAIMQRIALSQSNESERSSSGSRGEAKTAR